MSKLTLFPRFATIADRLGKLGHPLPARADREYLGSIVDAAGEEICAVDQYHELPDERARAITELLVAAINAGQHAKAPGQSSRPANTAQTDDTLYWRGLTARFVKALTNDGAHSETMLSIDHDRLSALIREARAAIVQSFKTVAPETEPGPINAVPADISGVWKQVHENHTAYQATGSTEEDIRFSAIGLVGEAGEVANFVKKRWRDGVGYDDDLRKECADVFAYNILLAQTLGMSPSDLIAMVEHKQQVFVENMQARAKERCTTDLAAAVKAVYRAHLTLFQCRIAKDASTFHGRSRTDEALSELRRAQAALTKVQSHDHS